MRLAESVKRRPSSTTRADFWRAGPESANPAMSRSRVDLPAPDGPKITVHSELNVHPMSRSKLPRWALRTSSSTAASRRPSAQVNCRQGNSTEAKQNECRAIGGGIVKVFDLIVEHDRKRARGSGNVSAQHQHDAELAHGMQKGEHRCGDQRAARKRDEQRGCDAELAGAEQARLVDQSRLDGGKTGHQRFDGERQAIEDRTDPKSGKGEGQRMSGK